MKKILCIFLGWIWIISSNAQSVRTPVSLTYAQLSGYTVKGANAFSFGANQAALANIKYISAGVYGERRFLLSELAHYQAALAIPTSTGNFGVKATYFGSPDNRETSLGLGYGRKLGTKVDIGAQFNYYAVDVSSYGTASTINFEAGLLLHITEQLHAGFHAYNPTGSRLNKGEEERLPAIYSAGLGYEASDKFFVSGEIQKIEDRDMSVNGAMQYSFEEKLFARAGFTSGTSSYFLGLGVMLKTFRLDATATIHPQLGVTPGIMLLFNGKQKGE